MYSNAFRKSVSVLFAFLLTIFVCITPFCGVVINNATNQLFYNVELNNFNEKEMSEIISYSDSKKKLSIFNIAFYEKLIENFKLVFKKILNSERYLFNIISKKRYETENNINIQELKKEPNRNKLLMRSDLLCNLPNKSVLEFANGFSDFIKKISKDILEYENYNENPEKVYYMNYFSNYRGSFVIKTPEYLEEFMGCGNIICVCYNYETTNQSFEDFNENISEVNNGMNYSMYLNHEYGHNLIAAQRGMVNAVFTNYLPSILGKTLGVSSNYVDKLANENNIKGGYFNQKWEADANMFGGLSYSYKVGESQFAISEPTNEYIEKFRPIKELPLILQELFISNNLIMNICRIAINIQSN